MQHHIAQAFTWKKPWYVLYTIYLCVDFKLYKMDINLSTSTVFIRIIYSVLLPFAFEIISSIAPSTVAMFISLKSTLFLVRLFKNWVDEK